MIKMSFYDGTLDRAKAREVVETSEKPLMFRYGFAYRGAEKRPITKEKANNVALIDTLMYNGLNIYIGRICL